VRRHAVAVKLPVLIAAGGAPWEADLVAALERGGAAVTVARRCVDVVDLLAVAASGQGRAALVAASLRRLDADAVDRLLAADVVPVGVVPRGDSATEDPPGAGTPVIADESTRQGSVIAVWGPTGAPGRTTVAITLADELARLGRSGLLIDADVYGGTVAAELGLLDESPGLAAACRLAAGTRLDGAALAGLCWQLRPDLRVLTGIPLATRWTELRPAAVTAVLAAARQLADYTVIDCGFCLETDEELSFDSLAPRRNGATLAVLDDADCVVVVGAADPVGMQRVVRGLAELRDAEIDAPAWVVLNKVRRGVVPGDTRAELIGALEQFAGATPAALLPYDRESLDIALATGRSLGEARPASPLRRAVVELAANLTGVPVPTGKRRR
jgi:MinD-like ATPase involved in chromosome partitioning or flagellar assembly